MSSLPLQIMRARGEFSRDPRFATLLGSAPASMSGRSTASVDPATEAYARGYADGAAHARDEALHTERDRDAARAKIELAFARFDDASAADLAEKLRQTVHALCEETILPLALDPAGLASRIEAAVGLLRRSQDERRVLVNPDDLPLIADRLPEGLTVEGDASVERGALRIETADGGVEDGPAQWRRILAEAFREC
ncbi:MAG TPA: FliH/SctL family protein [Croceibacterium sp.]|nr:FliH/SctL family protein [Croceibacterium sp.]